MWCDNIEATYLSINPILHAHTKHVELDYYFVRDRAVAKTLNVSFLSNKEQIADILTKQLGFFYFDQASPKATQAKKECKVVALT